MMENRILNAGSNWRKWDLHIHTPGTRLNDAYKLQEGEDLIYADKWDKYLDELENSDVSVFGITDYFSVDNYFQLIDKYRKRYPEGGKVVIGGHILAGEMTLDGLIKQSSNNNDQSSRNGGAGHKKQDRDFGNDSSHGAAHDHGGHDGGGHGGDNEKDG